MNQDDKLEQAESSHELAQQLVRARSQAHKLQAENDALLQGLQRLSAAADPAKLIDALIEMLKPFTALEHALIVEFESGEYAPLVASSEVLMAARWPAATSFSRALSGDTLLLFDTTLLPEWQALPEQVRGMAHSAIITSIADNRRQVLLICLHSRPHVFDHEARRLVSRFRPFLSQLMINLGFRHHLETLVEQRTQAHKESELRFKAFASSASDWFWETDDRLRLTYLTQPDRIAKQTSEFDLLSRRWLRLRSPNEQKQGRWRSLLKQLSARSPFQKLRFEIEPVPGKLRWIEVSGEPRFEAECFIGYRGTARDITDIKRKQLALEQAWRDAEQAAEAKSAFLAMMQHELMTPINGIVGGLELLSNEPMTPSQKEHLAMTSQSSALLESLLRDLLTLSQVRGDLNESMALPASNSASIHTVTALTTHALELWRSQATSKGLKLDCVVATTLANLSLVQGDLIAQVLFHLLGNAVKFSDSGTIRLEVSADDSHITFAILDQGPGFDENESSQLFGLFEQRDNSQTRTHQGSGLGLTLSQRIVESMAGTIGIESKQKAQPWSAKVWFSLPLVSVPEDNYIPELDTANQSLQVLVAEDSKSNQMVMKLMLQQLGHDVSLVDNGAEAVQAVSSSQFDLVLMDLRMPVMDGLEASRRIRELATPMCDVPIFALTANSGLKEAQQFAAIGVNKVLVKPLRSEQLQDSLSDLRG
ncbi:PAS domain-containing sensor histidine kinase [Corallincola spongiicola]|uniref:histidine kinase n=1 Tax=Corallincola spongiicola TaxID=2520508 RepID=A0ABY1WP72_9GAMM|nr:PAS domain-containing sensor histidine kinase [Corallincola spongiicola]TAA45870.1 PAS domain-containing sensor histidine kinase [Corallincola spongiicola]